MSFSPREKRPRPKLPVQQLSILAAVRFAEPLALTSVFPYLPEMIRSFGIPRDEVAKWAGLTSASFSICQSFTAVLWGRASDTFGRKPTLIVGMFTTMVCFLVWGMSTSLAMAITVRAIHGSGNGNVGIIRTVVAELVPEKSLQPIAFSIMPMIWSVGSVFGPAFGGFFANPAQKFPAVFGHSKLLIRFPFLLPNLIACVVFLCSLIMAIFFLKETLESKRHRKDWGLVLGQKFLSLFRRGRRSHAGFASRGRPRTRGRRSRRPSFADDEASAPLLPSADQGLDDDRDVSPDGLTPPSPAATDSPVQTAKRSAHEHIFTRQTSVVLLCYTLLALHSVSYDQVLPVFLNYPYQKPDESNSRLPFKFSGGFGISSGHIGTMFTITALVSSLAQFLVFPPLCARFGELLCYRVASLITPLIYLVTPYTVLIENEKLRFAAFMLTFIVKGCVGIVTFPCVTIILTNSAPSLSVLGTLNGIATTISGIGRACGPAMTGAAFSWGVKHGYMITGWWLLASVSIISAIPPFFITKGDGLKSRSTVDSTDRAGPDELEEGVEDDAFAFSDDETDENDDDFQETLLPALAGDRDAAGQLPQQPQLPKLRPASEWTQLHMQPQQAEDEPESLDDPVEDVSATATSSRHGRFRSLSSLSRHVGRDGLAEEDVPLSPVVAMEDK